MGTIGAWLLGASVGLLVLGLSLSAADGSPVVIWIALVAFCVAIALLVKDGSYV